MDEGPRYGWAAWSRLCRSGALAPRKLVQGDSCRNDVWSSDSLIDRPGRTVADPIEEDETSRIFLAQYRRAGSDVEK